MCSGGLGVTFTFSSRLLLCSAKEKPWLSPEVLPVEHSGSGSYLLLQLRKHFVVLCSVLYVSNGRYPLSGPVKLLSLSHWGGKKTSDRPLQCKFFSAPALNSPWNRQEPNVMADVQSRAPSCSLGAQVTVCPWFTKKLMRTYHQKAEADAVCMSLSQYVCDLCFAALLPIIAS